MAGKDDPRNKIASFPVSRDTLVGYMNERYSIYVKRQKGEPAPWTTNPILGAYKFTNVRREFDKTTLLLRSKFYRGFEQHKNIGLAAGLARFVGYFPTVEEVGFPEKWDVELIQRRMAARQARGEKLYTGAYMLQAPAGAGRPKYEYTVGLVLEGARRSGVLDRTYERMEDFWLAATGLHGWGGFMTQEVMLDLAGFSWILPAPTDLMTFAFAGPGAVRGLNWLAGRAVADSIHPVRAADEMMELREWLRKEANGLDPALRAVLTQHDVEFNLCEFDKYNRVLSGRGKPRSKYP